MSSRARHAPVVVTLAIAACAAVGGHAPAVACALLAAMVFGVSTFVGWTLFRRAPPRGRSTVRVGVMTTVCPRCVACEAPIGHGRVVAELDGETAHLRCVVTVSGKPVASRDRWCVPMSESGWAAWRAIDDANLVTEDESAFLAACDVLEREITAHQGPLNAQLALALVQRVRATRGVIPGAPRGVLN